MQTKTGLNNNDLIIGPSGSGKTRGYVLPNILLGNESMIIGDNKGNLKRQTEEILKRKGFRIIQIDFTDCQSSHLSAMTAAGIVTWSRIF